MRAQRSIALALAALALAAALSGCGGQEPQPTQPTTAPPPATTAPTSGVTTQPPDTQPAPQGLAYESYRREELVDEGGALLVKIDLGVPIPEGLEEAGRFYRDWADDAAYYAGLSQDQAREQRQAAEGQNQTFIPYEFSAGYEITRNDGVLFSALRHYVEHTGGVHPAETYFAENFVVEDGALLMAGDLFAVPAEEYLAALAERLADKLPEAVLQSYGSSPQEVMAAWEPKNFCVTQTGVLFFWQVYALAPYAAGPQLCELSYGELEGLVNPKWLP